MPSELAPSFRGGLLGCFDKEPSPADDWADVKLESSGNATIAEKSPQPQATVPGTLAVPEFLPNWESLPRPDDLLLRPPYYLTLDAGTQQIQIEGSHSPSLKLLSDYLKRWCRVNHNDTRSVSFTCPRDKNTPSDISSRVASRGHSEASPVRFRPERVV